MSDGMHNEMVMQKGLFGAMGAAVSGESPFQQVYHNRTNNPGYVACTSDIPGVLVPVDMSRCGTLKCKLGAWVCSVGKQETQINVDFNGGKGLGGMCCSGMSFIVQSLSGGSWSFLCAMGTVISKELQQGEEIIVDTNSILAYTDQVQMDVRAVGGCGAMCCAGEGAFNTVLTGPGKIFLQSMPIEKLRALFPKPSPPGEGGGGGDDGGGGGD